MAAPPAEDTGDVDDLVCVHVDIFSMMVLFRLEIFNSCPLNSC